MKELLTYIVQSLVDKPDEVSVTERKADGETVFEVRVADGDMGKVIGRQGRIVKEIRVLMKAVAKWRGLKVSVYIVECFLLVRGENRPARTMLYALSAAGCDPPFLVW